MHSEIQYSRSYKVGKQVSDRRHNATLAAHVWVTHVEYNARRSESYDARRFHKCDKTCDVFCYFCCKYVLSKTEIAINELKTY